MRSGGHMADMQNRLKYNRSLIRTRSSLNSKRAYLLASKVEEVNLVEATKEELQRVKARAREFRKNQIKRSVLPLAVSIILTVVFFLQC